MATVADDAREQQLAWEARQRPRAAVAAIVSGLLGLVSPLWAALVLRDSPPASFLESLAHAGRPGPIGDQPSLKVPLYTLYQDNALTLIGSGFVRGLSLLALAWTITFLAAATRARRPEFVRLAVYLGLVGGALFALSSLLAPIGTVTAVSDFLDGPKTVDTARDIGGSTLLITASLLGQIGQLALVAGLFLVSLNAMRAGLLTRFLGILGVIAAVLIILPILPTPLPVIESFWVIAVGLLLLGAGRAGLPPAWRTGMAEPWQTNAMEGAQRRRAAEERKQGIVPAPEPDPEPEPVPAGRPHPSSKKRKRKRRG